MRNLAFIQYLIIPEGEDESQPIRLQGVSSLTIGGAVTTGDAGIQVSHNGVDWFDLPGTEGALTDGEVTILRDVSFPYIRAVSSASEGEERRFPLSAAEIA